MSSFPKFRPKNQKLSISTKNRHSWYIGGVDSESRLIFFKCPPKNLYLGKFGPNNSNLSVLSQNWCTQYVKDADSESRFRFLKFLPQRQICAQKVKIVGFVWKIGAYSISMILIPDPDLDFWNFDPKIYFWANLGPKIKNVCFVWKLVHMVLQGCRFLLQHYFSEFQILISF